MNRWTKKQTERYNTDSLSKRQTDLQIDIQKYNTHTAQQKVDRWTNRLIDKKIDRQIKRQTERQNTDRQDIHRWMERQSYDYKHIYRNRCLEKEVYGAKVKIKLQYEFGQRL